MNSNILEKLGMNTIDPAIFIIVLLVICIGLLVYNIINSKKIKKLTEKYNKFLKGKDAETLEDVIFKRFEEIDRLVVSDRVKTGQIQEIFDNLTVVYQKTGIVKYDAFNEMGGKLSFALCLLDKKNNGFIINAMHSREGCYTYTKEIINGDSFIALGDEEKQALEMAINGEL